MTAARLGAVGAFVLLALGFPQAQTAQQVPPSTGVLVGVVVDQSNGKPIPDAVVTVTLRAVLGPPPPPGPPAPRGFEPQGVLTDPSGRFAFTGLPGGASLIVQATKSGYQNSSIGVELRDGERLTNATISLTKFASISGRVIDDVGDPVVGLTVRAHRWVYGLSGRPRLDQGVNGHTDDRGAYRIAVLVPGDYVIVVPFTQATLPLATTTAYMAAAYGDRELSSDIIRVTRFPSLDVLGSQDARRVGDLVLITEPGTHYPPDPLEPRRATAYRTTFAPSAPVASSATTITLRSGEERTGVDVQLTLVPTVTVSGTVVGPEGPVARAGLLLLPVGWELPDLRDFTPASALANASGAFTFLNVPAGQYTLRGIKTPLDAMPASSLWSDQSLTVGDTPVDGLRVTLRRPVRVTGQVRFDGAGELSAEELARLQKAQIRVALTAVDRGSSASALVDSSGTFALSVPGGRYAMGSFVIGSATAPWVLESAIWQGRDLARSPIELKDDEISGVIATFTDRPAQISGTVRNAQGAPEKAATVLLMPADSAGWADYGTFLSVGTTLTGAYTFARVPAGDYLLVALVEAPAAPSAIDVPGVLRDWRDPRFLRAVSGAAVRVRVPDREVVTQELKTTVIR